MFCPTANFVKLINFDFYRASHIKYMSLLLPPPPPPELLLQLRPWFYLCRCTKGDGVKYLDSNINMLFCRMTFMMEKIMHQTDKILKIWEIKLATGL